MLCAWEHHLHACFVWELPSDFLQNFKVWKRKAEQYLADSGLPYTIIRLYNTRRVAKAITVNAYVGNLLFVFLFLAELAVYKIKMVACES